jgi:MFS transporter, PPP family, 3-phenylpropionic acid transporter
MAAGEQTNLPAPARPLPRFLALYACLYASFGVASPFMPAFIESRGIPIEQIGAIFAAGTAVRLLSAPLVAHLADRLGARRQVLAACALGAALAAVLYLLVSSLWIIVIVFMLQAIALAPLTPLTDAMALLATKAPREAVQPGFEYGWVRGAGSAAFVIGNVIVGSVLSLGTLSLILWIQAALLLMVPLAAWLVPSEQVASRPQTDPVISKEAVTALLQEPMFRRVIAVAALILGSHAMHDTFAVIRWSSAGISPATVSLLWSASVIAEVVVFILIGPPLVSRLGPAGAIALAALAAAARWGLAALSADLVVLVLTQPLHGLTFALMHLACMRLLAEAVPEDLAATAQAIYGTVGVGSATVLLTLLSGWLYARMGPEAFGLMGLLCLAAVPLAASLRERGRTL